MKIKERAIFSPLGIKITQSQTEAKNGCCFVFEDINPCVEFKNVFTKKERLLLAWFFFRSLFNTRKSA
jgi:hypothetical protein